MHWRKSSITSGHNIKKYTIHIAHINRTLTKSWELFSVNTYSKKIFCSRKCCEEKNWNFSTYFVEYSANDAVHCCVQKKVCRKIASLCQMLAPRSSTGNTSWNLSSCAQIFTPISMRPSWPGKVKNWTAEKNYLVTVTNRKTKLNQISWICLIINPPSMFTISPWYFTKTTVFWIVESFYEFTRMLLYYSYNRNTSTKTHKQTQKANIKLKWTVAAKKCPTS